MLALMIPAAPAFGALSRLIQFDVFLGYDGAVRESNWYPVSFEVKNDGPSFVGVIELSAERFGEGQTHQVVVELPTGTQKRIYLPLFAYSRYAGGWDARLLNEDGKVMAELSGVQPRRQIPWQVPLMGAVVRTAGGMPSLPEVPRNMQAWEPSAARLLPALFPDTPIALGGLDALYLNSEVALDLRVPQYTALLTWVQDGGHLIVSVEQPGDINGNPWLNAFLPCNLRDVTTATSQGAFQDWLKNDRSIRLLGGASRLREERSLSKGENPFAKLAEDAAFELEAFPIALATLRDGEVVLSVQDRPLMVTAGRGRGQVTVLTFNPEKEPFKSWKNLPWMWAKLLDVSPEVYASSEMRNYYSTALDGVFGSMVDSRQISKLPVTWLLFLLVVYLVVIGPLDQFWLKRIRRQMLTWITFPCYVVLFSVLIYLIGYKLRAGDTEWNELHVVDVLPRPQGTQSMWSGRTFASLYSPANERYPVAKTNTFANLRGEYLANVGNQGQGRNLVVQRGDGFEAAVFVQVWTSQMFVSDWFQSGPQLLAASFEREGGGWRVAITNLLDRTLSPVWVVVGDRIHPVEAIEANATRSLRSTERPGMDLRGFVRQHAGQFQTAAQRRRRALGDDSGYRIDDRAQSSVAASFISLVEANRNTPYDTSGFVIQKGLDLVPVAERDNAIVLAWVDGYSPVEPLNRFQPRREHRYTLLRLAVPMAP